MRTKSTHSARPRTAAAYLESVNKAIDYIVPHLDEPLRLTKVARIAHVSPFHFHRVFQVLTGETPADFVKRLRLHRALVMMAQTPRMPMIEVALACGFASASDFSRSFKQRFGCAPSAFDMGAWRKGHAGELDALVEAALSPSGKQHHVAKMGSNANPDGFKVKIRELPARRVAYIRVRNPYAGTAVVEAVNRLVAWAEKNGLDGGQWLGYQWENPEVVPLEQCRYHAAVVAEDFVPRGEIGSYRFERMTVAQVEMRGGIDLELRALRWLYGTWLPRSGYVPDDQPCFEAWIGKPFALGMEEFAINVQLPVR